MRKAVKRCVEHDMLKEFLKAVAAVAAVAWEAMNMLLTEWDWNDARATGARNVWKRAWLKALQSGGMKVIQERLAARRGFADVKCADMRGRFPNPETKSVKRPLKRNVLIFFSLYNRVHLMGIIDRLSDVIRSYLSEDSFSYEKRRRTYSADSDLEAAYEELNEFLGRGEGRGAAHDFEGQFRNAHAAAATAATAAPGSPPEALRPAFAELGVPFGADPEACKTAYKKLLKIHHPDRHAEHAENMRKATEKSARINDAYERIERWRSTGTV
ncbi:MAG: J domain-containing protein [Treponema sp.]|jgi:hypothetical protein|nr:J domain-containing protein [Treponema sp.]